jgi:hypothetical protein
MKDIATFKNFRHLNVGRTAFTGAAGRRQHLAG